MLIFEIKKMYKGKKHISKYKKLNKKKWAEHLNRHFSKEERITTDGQRAHEKMPLITNY